MNEDVNEDEEYKPKDFLSKRDLDNLQWAKDFMNMFENKKGLVASLNRSRQAKYF